jgi:hypothetical protein
MTIEAIEQVLAESVFGSSEVQAISPLSLPYEHTEDSEFELSALYYGTKINFFEYTVSEGEDSTLVGGGLDAIRYTYRIEVRYTFEADTQGQAYALARAGMRAVLNAIKATGSNLSGSVGWYELDGTPVDISRAEVDGRPVWRAYTKFMAYRQS